MLFKIVVIHVLVWYSLVHVFRRQLKINLAIFPHVIGIIKLLNVIARLRRNLSSKFSAVKMFKLSYNLSH